MMAAALRKQPAARHQGRITPRCTTSLAASRTSRAAANPWRPA